MGAALGYRQRRVTIKPHAPLPEKKGENACCAGLIIIRLLRNGVRKEAKLVLSIKASIGFSDREARPCRTGVLRQRGKTVPNWGSQTERQNRA